MKYGFWIKSKNFANFVFSAKVIEIDFSTTALPFVTIIFILTSSIDLSNSNFAIYFPVFTLFASSEIVYWDWSFSPNLT